MTRPLSGINVALQQHRREVHDDTRWNRQQCQARGPTAGYCGSTDDVAARQERTRSHGEAGATVRPDVRGYRQPSMFYDTRVIGERCLVWEGGKARRWKHVAGGTPAGRRQEMHVVNSDRTRGTAHAWRADQAGVIDGREGELARTANNHPNQPSAAQVGNRNRHSSVKSVRPECSCRLAKRREARTTRTEECHGAAVHEMPRPGRQARRAVCGVSTARRSSG